MVALSQQGPLRFATVMVRLVQAFMLRETNGKEICVDLAKVGRIGGNRKPRDADMIKLRGPAKGLRLARGMRPALSEESHQEAAHVPQKAEAKSGRRRVRSVPWHRCDRNLESGGPGGQTATGLS
jgi:hypothetical protein